MIQRIQTLFLLLAAGVMACFCFMNLAIVQTESSIWNITALGLYTESGNQAITTWHTLALSVLAAVMPFIALFLFKRQKMQKLLSYLTILFDFVLIAVLAYEGYGMLDATSTAWTVVLLAPFLSVCLCALAIRYINKDINLLKSYDRIR